MYQADDEWQNTATRLDRPLPTLSVNLDKWCRENCNRQYEINLWEVLFELESDAVLFQLKWGTV